MRIPERLSPTALALWEESREKFYFKYLAEPRPPRDPQTQPMAVGSAFDAYVKARLHAAIFGAGYDAAYSLDALMETQVEPHVRDWARSAGRHVFQAYTFTGAYDALLADLMAAAEPPRFEFTAQGEVGNVPAQGKPDCMYTHACGAKVMLDWKVNGYCSKRATSPKKLYAMCRDGQDMEKPTRGIGKPHKKYEEIEHAGLVIGSHCLSESDKKWADQLSVYGWLTGEVVGSQDMVVRIDQIVAKPGDPVPYLRVANHRCRVSAFWQHSLARRLQDCWTTILSGHIFTEDTRAESDEQCEVLDMLASYTVEEANDKGA